MVNDILMTLKVSCPNELRSLLSQDPMLCANSTFWLKQPCTSVLGNGKRCKGRNSGQCVYPLTSYDYVTSRRCEDKSDNVHTLNAKCPSYLIEEHPHCQKEVDKYCRDTEYKSYWDYWESCLSCYDPGNCTGSCEIPRISGSYSSVTHPHCR